MKEINASFYELVDRQSPAMKKPINHPYEVDWIKYDQLQRMHEIKGELR